MSVNVRANGCLRLAASDAVIRCPERPCSTQVRGGTQLCRRRGMCRSRAAPLPPHAEEHDAYRCRRNLLIVKRSAGQSVSQTAANTQKIGMDGHTPE